MNKTIKKIITIISGTVAAIAVIFISFALPTVTSILKEKTESTSEVAAETETEQKVVAANDTEEEPGNAEKNDSVQVTNISAGNNGASEIVTSDMESIASTLKESSTKIAEIEMSDSNSNIEISESGIYQISGNCSDGNITVKKGTTGVVLILKDLTLTSKTGATVSVNKGSNVKMVVQGTVNLTDAENPDDENSSDQETADAFDGAVIKVKAGADLYITGSGNLNINGDCKNGIKSNDDASTVCIIDGPTVNIKATNDAINAGYDMTILSGTVDINAGDDAIHADRILTLGSENSSPVINIESSKEGLEGTVVNIVSGDITVNASDDAVNAGNSDKTYESEMAYSINVLGGTTEINSNGDGLDSNGNINLVAGSLTINCRNNGGEGGIDYNDSYYISEDMNLTNNGGITFDSGSGEMGGGKFGGGQYDSSRFENGTFERPQFGDGERPQMPEGFDFGDFSQDGNFGGHGGKHMKPAGSTDDEDGNTTTTM